MNVIEKLSGLDCGIASFLKHVCTVNWGFVITNFINLASTFLQIVSASLLNFFYWYTGTSKVNIQSDTSKVNSIMPSLFRDFLLFLALSLSSGVIKRFEKYPQKRFNNRFSLKITASYKNIASRKLVRKKRDFSKYDRERKRTKSKFGE